MLIRWSRPWCRSACFRPATPTTSSRRPRCCAALRAASRRRCATCWRSVCIAWSKEPPQLYGAKASLAYKRGDPVLANHARQADFAASVAGNVVGRDNVEEDTPPVMGAEDFAYMLQARPGAFVFIGNGDSAGLHHPAYDFNDEIIPIGASYWVRLVETALAA